MLSVRRRKHGPARAWRAAPSRCLAAFQPAAAPSGAPSRHQGTCRTSRPGPGDGAGRAGTQIALTTGSAVGMHDERRYGKAKPCGKAATTRGVLGRRGGGRAPVVMSAAHAAVHDDAGLPCACARCCPSPQHRDPHPQPDTDNIARAGTAVTGQSPCCCRCTGGDLPSAEPHYCGLLAPLLQRLGPVVLVKGAPELRCGALLHRLRLGLGAAVHLLSRQLQQAHQHLAACGRGMGSRGGVRLGCGLVAGRAPASPAAQRALAPS